MTNPTKRRGTTQHCNEPPLLSWLRRRRPPGRLARKDHGRTGHRCQAQAQREEQLRLPTVNQDPAPEDHQTTLQQPRDEEGQSAPCYPCRAASPNTTALT
jgi:hypothetical protein